MTERRSGRAEAQQERSRRTEVAILKAVRDMLTDDPVSPLSINEVARRAGVSVGGLYGRFPGGKSGMVHALYEATLAAWREALADALPDEKVGQLDLENIVEGYARVMVGCFEEDRPLLLAAHRMKAQGQLDPEVEKAGRDFDSAVHGRFIEHALATTEATQASGDAEPVLRFALLQMSAAARSAALFHGWGLEDSAGRGRLHEELAVAAVAYIRARL